MKEKESLRKELRCRNFPLNTLGEYQYTVICSRYQGKWILSRHRNRYTWETQGGHIEDGETPLEAAKRELYEESGIRDAEVYPVCDYLGYNHLRSANGMVFLAVVHSIGQLPESEMGEIGIFEELPENLTYPLTSPMLYREAEKYLHWLEGTENMCALPISATISGKTEGEQWAMEELRTILTAHAKRYPLMEPTDGVKLIYQNEFGGGHLIRDEQSCLNYLRREYESVVPDPHIPQCEEIGNGIVRVNLAAVKPEELEWLGKSFLSSAAGHTGSMDVFLRKLEVLCQLTAEGVFSFGTGELEDYLSQYRKSGCPMVSHSETYRKHYAPAYRILLSKFCQSA